MINYVINYASDVYQSINTGSIIYHILYFKLQFPGHQRTCIDEKLYIHITRSCPSLSILCSDNYCLTKALQTFSLKLFVVHNLIYLQVRIFQTLSVSLLPLNVFSLITFSEICEFAIC